jgi:hypothetical protein
MGKEHQHDGGNGINEDIDTFQNIAAASIAGLIDDNDHDDDCASFFGDDNDVEPVKEPELEYGAEPDHGSSGDEDETQNLSCRLKTADHPNIFNQHFEDYIRNKDWWPGNNYTVIALAAWQSWARLSRNKMRWLLEFLKTGQNPPCECDTDADMSFRVDHVPSLQDLEQIIARLPKIQPKMFRFRQEVQSQDGPSGNKTVSSKQTDVAILLPSEIIKREVANQMVSQHLCLKPSSIPTNDLHSPRRDFTDSVYYSNPSSTLSPYICFDSFPKAYLGEAVLHRNGCIYIIVDIAINDQSDTMDTAQRNESEHCMQTLQAITKAIYRPIKTSPMAGQLKRNTCYSSSPA